jgi:phosphomannomutase
MNDSDGRRRDLVDGVKIYLDDASSALLIPDKERPLFHINTEAPTPEAAEGLAAAYEKKVMAWRDEP